MFIPLGPVVLFLAIAFLVNYLVCLQLNGTREYFESHTGNTREEHESEYWMYLNGISVGHHWLQNNLDRLSMTFGRKIHGVHNPTWGIIFDLIQCIIQRDFCYYGQDIRNSYRTVREALFNDRYKKVVLILHSQGGIEGGMILDWLLAEVPTELMNQLEVYTFGNASNHFNNPHHHVPSQTSAASSKRDKKAISHIEHYTNSGDFVSRWGVLHFVRYRSTQKTANQYMGRVFACPATGHLLNQHYLDYLFPLKDGQKSFMDTPIRVGASGEDWWDNVLSGTKTRGSGPFVEVYDTSALVENDSPSVLRVKDVSRLWKYRNGMIPSDADDDDQGAEKTN